MHTLKPASTDSTTGSTSSKTARWSDASPKQWSKLKVLRPSLPGCERTTSLSDVTLTAELPSPAASGRTRHMTRIDPLSSCSWSCSSRRLRSSFCQPVTACSRAGSTTSAAHCITARRYCSAISSTGRLAESIAAESKPAEPTQPKSSPDSVPGASPAFAAISLRIVAAAVSKALRSAACTSTAGGGTGSRAFCAATAACAADFSSAANAVACACCSSERICTRSCFCSACACSSCALAVALFCSAVCA